MPQPARIDQLIANCKSWSDFTRALALLNAQEKGDAFERLTQLYFLTRPEFGGTKVRDVWVCKWDLPPKIRKQLKLPNADEGIDLVAQARDGCFWAIQSKYKSDKDKPPTRKELSTFASLAFINCRGLFSEAWVAHSSNRPVRKGKLAGHTSEIGVGAWLALGREDWGLIHNRLTGKAARPKRRLPRPHQWAAIKAATAHFAKKRQRRGKLIMPCGTGKSLTAYWIAKALKAKTILVAVPSLALIKQGVEDWTREIVATGEKPLAEWLCVCSDESAGSVERDQFVADVYELGLDVTTEPEKIKSFLTSRTKSRRIVFTTYQSSPLLANVARKAGVEFDLAILDEAHKTAGAKGKTFATLLFDKKMKIRRRIFMTATERVVKGEHDEIVSMDSESLYGRVFYQLTFKQAIHSKPPIISNYKVLTLLVTEDEIKALLRDRRLLTDRRIGLEEKDPRGLCAGIALQKAFGKYGIKHAISFHRSIRSADDFRAQQARLVDARVLRPSVNCLHISSQKTAGERAELLEEFAEAERALMTNARCLTEGVDVPAIDCVLFADPKQSKIDIVQAAGRALRPYPGKKFGYIMLPLVVPDGMTVEEFTETTEFREVGRVLAALSTQDERIAEEFRVVERGKKPNGRIVEIEGSVPIGMKIDLREFAEGISAKLWERVGRVNWRPFFEAREFARSLGLKSGSDWKEFTKSGKLPKDIPAYPDQTYADQGWTGWGDWLGTGTIAPHLREYRTFERARVFAQSLGLKSEGEWRVFTKSGKLPQDIPANPYKTYADRGWKGMGDWLGTETIATFLREYRTFEKARAFARSLGMKSVGGWQVFVKSGKLPKDIPAAPSHTYADKGWVSWGDWLGTGTIATHLRNYRTFEKARVFARSLDLKSVGDWRVFTKSGKLPKDIPAFPEQTYADQGWMGMGDWLGTGTVATNLRKYRSFEKARAFARSLGLKSRDSWQVFTKSGKLPKDIPATPEKTYADQGWKGMGDWLGTGTIAPSLREYRTFEKARAFARSLGLKSRGEWEVFTKSGKLPKDIPAAPSHTYADKGWKGWGDWLGTETIAHKLREYRTFEKARAFARSLGLKSGGDWRAFTKSGKLPKDIPARPNRTYAEQGWKGMGDWLGTGTVASHLRKYRPFGTARAFARSLGLKSGGDWQVFTKSGKLPKDIPAAPSHTYADQGWKGMGDWLGTGTIAPHLREYRTFERARAFAQSLCLKSEGEWRLFTKSGKLPKDIPAYPNQTYADHRWKGMGDWLGTGTIATSLRDFKSFEKARAFARSLGLKSGGDWRVFTKSGKLPKDIPTNPNRTYADKGWKAWGDWLGTRTVATHLRKYRSFEKAQAFARSLRLKSGGDWRVFTKSGKLPKDIPAAPHQTYADQGWKGMGDWLGNGRPPRKKRTESSPSAQKRSASSARQSPVGRVRSMGSSRRPARS